MHRDMTTALIKIAYNDGRIFKIFCANSNQIDRVRRAIPENATATVIDNGMHTVKQWENILEM